jgi:ribosomal protein L14E/L6E/L27E
MFTDQIRPGSVVYATAGKEQGGFYMVTQVGAGFVLIADGKHRPLERPKRKNLRHIRLTQTVWEPEGMSNKALRARLREYSAPGTAVTGGNRFV